MIGFAVDVDTIVSCFLTCCTGLFCERIARRIEGLTAVFWMQGVPDIFVAFEHESFDAVGVTLLTHDVEITQNDPCLDVAVSFEFFEQMIELKVSLFGRLLRAIAREVDDRNLDRSFFGVPFTTKNAFGRVGFLSLKRDGVAAQDDLSIRCELCSFRFIGTIILSTYPLLCEQRLQECRGDFL